MKITGLRKSVRGSSFRNESLIAAKTISRVKMDCVGCHDVLLSSARLSSSTFTPGSPKRPSQRPSVLSSINCCTLRHGAALLRDARGLQLRVRRGDVRVDARGGRRDGVDGDVADREPGL